MKDDPFDDPDKLRLPPMAEVHLQQTPKDKLIGCPWWWLQCVLPVVKSKDQLAVAIYLWRRRIVRGNRKMFDVPNVELLTLKISRKTKYRTLDLLAAAGLIKINRSSAKAAPVVTILAEKPRSK